MYRNRQTAFWALFVPLLLVTVFGVFNMNEYSKSKIGILDLAQSESSSQLINELNKVQGWNLFIEDEPNTLQNKLESGALEYGIYIPEDFSDTEPFINIQYASTNDVSKSWSIKLTPRFLQEL